MNRTAVAALLGSMLACGLAVSTLPCERASASPGAHQPVGSASQTSPTGSSSAAPVNSAPESSAAGVRQRRPSAREVRVRRLAVTTALTGREPIPVRGPLRLGDAPVLAFVELENSEILDQTIVVSFVRERSRTVARIELPVPAEQRRWRTWAESRLVRAPGNWDAVVSLPDGKELARVRFEVTAD